MSLPAGRYADGNGLYVQVLPGGGRSWLFRYDLAGRCTRLTSPGLTSAMGKRPMTGNT